MTKNTQNDLVASFSLRSLFLALLFALSLVPATGQFTSGSVEVRVVDSNEAAVRNAEVTITSKKTGQSRTALTSSEGIAIFKSIPPGLYDISVLSQGFAKLTSQNVRIAPTEKKAITLTLIIQARAPAGETVVTAVEESQQAALQEEVSPLPNLNNDLTPLLQVVPGAVATGSSALGRVIVDGKGSDQQTVRLDGVDFTILTELPVADPAIDAASSFQKPEVAGDLDSSGVARGAFAPISGPGTGSVAETVTYKAIRETAPLKASVWRAQVYGEHRNDALNARNFFDFVGKNALRRSRFGGKVGGPLDDKDNNFLFFAYDGIRGRTERNVYEAIPVDAACGCATGPLGRFLQGYLPEGTNLVAGASLNPDFLVARRRNRTTVASNAFSIRYDYYPFTGSKDDEGRDLPKSNNVLTIRFVRQSAENIVPDGITGRKQHQQIIFTNALVSFLAATGSSTHTIKFGLNRTHVNVRTEIPDQLDPSLDDELIAIGGSVNVLGLPEQISSVPIATLGGLAKNVGRGFTLTPTSHSVGYDSFWQLKDGYELRFGFEARFINLKIDRLGGLTYSFPNIASLRTGIPGTVTFLSDLSKPGPFSSRTGPRQARQQYFMGYFQNMLPVGTPQPNPTNGKTESRLVFTYGIRYDYFAPVKERDDRAVVVNPQTGEILPPGTPFYRTSKFNIQPRIGLVYRLHDTNFWRNTILRAGVGVYSGVPRTGDLLLPIESDRFSTGITGGSFPANPADVVSGFTSNPDTRQFQPLAFARDFSPLERLYKWEAQLTHTVRGYDVGLLYSGNVGRNLPLANIANKIIGVANNPDPSQPAIVVREFDIVRAGQVFKPFGEFFYRTGDGHSSYDGLTVLFKRNLRGEKPPEPSSWLREAVMNFNVQYTFSRNRGNVSGMVASNPSDFESDLGFNAADVRHSFRLSAVYDLWKVRRADSTHPLVGWKIIPSLKASSGLPLIIRINRPDVVYVDAAGNVFSSPATGRSAIINTPGGGESGSARVPDLLPGVNPYLNQDLELLNPAAFAIPAPGKFGNLSRGRLRGPAMFQFDLGIRRNLFRSEKAKIAGEFQADIYNVFNRVNFINPSVPLPGLLGTNAANNQLQPGTPFSRTTAGSFGKILAADIGRLVQFSLTLRFNDGFTK